jgi:hypothetical protein
MIGTEHERPRRVPSTGPPASVTGSAQGARLRRRLGGYTALMTDYSEHGAIPVEDAAVPDPPTVDEVLERQRAEHPDQADTSPPRSAPSGEEVATAEAGGEVVGREPSGGVDIEGPNSA